MALHHRINRDGLGIFTSLLCAIHCAVLPLAVSFLPLLGLSFMRNPLFEHGMIGLAFAIGSWALWHGFTRHHQRLARDFPDLEKQAGGDSLPLQH